MKKHRFRRETEAVRGGTDIGKKNGPLATPIYQTSTFEAADMQEQVRVIPTDSFYTRYGNPTNTSSKMPSPNWKAPTPPCCSLPVWPRSRLRFSRW